MFCKRFRKDINEQLRSIDIKLERILFFLKLREELKRLENKIDLSNQNQTFHGLVKELNNILVEFEESIRRLP